MVTRRFDACPGAVRRIGISAARSIRRTRISRCRRDARDSISPECGSCPPGGPAQARPRCGPGPVRGSARSLRGQRGFVLPDELRRRDLRTPWTWAFGARARMEWWLVVEPTAADLPNWRGPISGSAGRHRRRAAPATPLAALFPARHRFHLVDMPSCHLSTELRRARRGASLLSRAPAVGADPAPWADVPSPGALRSADPAAFWQRCLGHPDCPAGEPGSPAYNRAM